MVTIAMTQSALAHLPTEPAESSAEAEAVFHHLVSRYTTLCLEHRDIPQSIDVEATGRSTQDIVLDAGSHADASQLADWCKSLDGDPVLVERLVDRWLETFERLLVGLPAGTAVVIDLLTGHYVVAPTRLAALDAFEARFGRNGTVAWLHEVGRGIVMRGGLA